jgi:hypothetical protein
MIWLGPADAGTQVAFQLLHKLEESFKHDQPIPMDERHVADVTHTQIRADLALRLGKYMVPPLPTPDGER